jgi:putative flavoprotein involved in K+ transport
MAWHLRRLGREAIILERARVAERWRTERWDGLRFMFPNWSVALPGRGFPHDAPDGFASAPVIAGFIEDYAREIGVPLFTGVTATGLEPVADGFLVETDHGAILAEKVVLATGPYQRVVIPGSLAGGIGVPALHTRDYRNPDALPPGGVLIIGAGASGTQIAEELRDAGRDVLISVGRHRRLPRRYRGRDFIWWLSRLGLDKMSPADRAPNPAPVVLTGAKGGYTLDFRDLAARGIRLLGRAETAQDGVMTFGPDLARDIAAGDAAYLAFLDAADAAVARDGLDLPEEPGARFVRPVPEGGPSAVDLRAVGVGVVLWATGYGLDFGWLRGVRLDAIGAPTHRDGVCETPGLFVIGLNWLSGVYSSILSGVGRDAERLAGLVGAERPDHP